jgi:hypothetical protein
MTIRVRGFQKSSKSHIDAASRCFRDRPPRAVAFRYAQLVRQQTMWKRMKIQPDSLSEKPVNHSVCEFVLSALGTAQLRTPPCDSLVTVHVLGERPCPNSKPRPRPVLRREGVEQLAGVRRHPALPKRRDGSSRHPAAKEAGAAGSAKHRRHSFFSLGRSESCVGDKPVMQVRSIPDHTVDQGDDVRALHKPRQRRKQVWGWALSAQSLHDSLNNGLPAREPYAASGAHVLWRRIVRLQQQAM